MSTKVIKALDAAERAKLAEQTQQIAGMPLPQVDMESGNEFVFVTHFDGTYNDKDNLELSGSPYPTNVARLHELMVPHAEDNENYVSHYGQAWPLLPFGGPLGGIKLVSAHPAICAQRQRVHMKSSAKKPMNG